MQIKIDICFIGAVRMEGSGSSDAPPDRTKGNGHRLEHIKKFGECEKIILLS